MNARDLLISGLDELGLPYTEKEITAFLTFLSELKKWNRAYSLTSIKTDKEIIIKHFFDSLLYLNAIPDNAMNIADLGSGPGFPGIPIKIIRPDPVMTLVESSRKKASFLKHIVRLLDLKGINVLQQRAEEMGEDLRKNFDVVISRATFKTPDFLRIACPYVKKNGILILSKGPGFSKELEGLVSADGIVHEVRKAGLPYEGSIRNLVILRCN
jgi:16S rRNA (guanine527-N7)-methyltransferase